VVLLNTFRHIAGHDDFLPRSYPIHYFPRLAMYFELLTASLNKVRTSKYIHTRDLRLRHGGNEIFAVLGCYVA
jgi:hypothetical protein